MHKRPQTSTELQQFTTKCSQRENRSCLRGKEEGSEAACMSTCIMQADAYMLDMHMHIMPWHIAAMRGRQCMLCACQSMYDAILQVQVRSPGVVHACCTALAPCTHVQNCMLSVHGRHESKSKCSMLGHRSCCSLTCAPRHATLDNSADQLLCFCACNITCHYPMRTGAHSPSLVAVSSSLTTQA